MLAAVVRGVSDLSVERVWVPPNRWRPVRLNILMEEPRLIFPRNVHTLRDEAYVLQHSATLASRRMTITNTLERLELPGCEDNLLICDRVAIHFESPQLTTHLEGSSVGQAPDQVVLTLTRSIERPHALVPALRSKQ